MKRVVIVEDEILAVKRLQRILGENIDFELLATLDSVINSVKWLANNEPPDIIFMDIQLGDGLSFEIFDIVQVNCPVVFITAYNQYAIEAFKLNSIAYLLKPVSSEDLNMALLKLDEMKKMFSQATLRQQVEELRVNLKEGYKKRFILKVGDHIKSMPIENAAYFFSRDKATYIKTSEGRNYLLDYTLDQLSDLLNPKDYYRINRQYLVGINSIDDIVSYSNSRLELKLPNQEENNIIVSRERVNEFKKWLDR